MLTSIAIMALLLGPQSQGPRPHASDLTLQDDAFAFGSGTASCVERIAPPKPPQPKQVVFRRNGNFAVWDGRGLSVRHKNRTKSSKLTEMALTPKLFTRDEILRTRALLAQGIRRKAASALSGCRRIGSEVFFLVRWVESTGKPWLEALVKVDLDSDVLKPTLVGKFDGLSLATDPVDDKMLLLAGALCVVTRSESGWSLAKYDPSLHTFSADALGVGLVSYFPLGRELGVFVERRPSGTFMIGRVDLATGTRRNLHETRDTVQILDEKRPSIAILGRSWLLNLESGAKTPLPSDSTVRRTTAGILVWWPSKAPARAAMLAPDRWTQLATWTKGRGKPAVGGKRTREGDDR